MRIGGFGGMQNWMPVAHMAGRVASASAFMMATPMPFFGGYGAAGLGMYGFSRFMPRMPSFGTYCYGNGGGFSYWSGMGSGAMNFWNGGYNPDYYDSSSSKPKSSKQKKDSSTEDKSTKETTPADSTGSPGAAPGGGTPGSGAVNPPALPAGGYKPSPAWGPSSPAGYVPPPAVAADSPDGGYVSPPSVDTAPSVGETPVAEFQSALNDIPGVTSISYDAGSRSVTVGTLGRKRSGT